MENVLLDCCWMTFTENSLLIDVLLFNKVVCIKIKICSENKKHRLILICFAVFKGDEETRLVISIVHSLSGPYKLNDWDWLIDSIAYAVWSWLVLTSSYDAAPKHNTLNFC